MRRTKADAYLHAHGKPLKSVNDARGRQLFLEDFGMTYRERLMACEREVMSHRLSGEEVVVDDDKAS